jgi:hypothetical protein
VIIGIEVWADFNKVGYGSIFVHGFLSILMTLMTHIKESEQKIMATYAYAGTAVINYIALGIVVI